MARNKFIDWDATEFSSAKLLKNIREADIARDLAKQTAETEKSVPFITYIKSRYA